MASSSRASRSIRSTVSASVATQFVCRTCRHHLPQSTAQQIRSTSILSSSRPLQRQLWSRSCQRRSISFNSITGRFQSPKEQSPGDALGPTMEPYEEASTWEGLEHLGHQGHWRELPPSPEDEFEPWLDQTTAAPVNRDEFLAYLYIAIVECLAYKQQGKEPSIIFESGPPALGRDMPSLRIQLSSSGTISHLEDPKGVLQRRKQKSSGDKTNINIPIPDVIEQLSGAKFDFSNPLTFTILKRFSQLTGHRVPDPLLNTTLRGNKDMTNFIDLLTQSAKPKPKKLAEILVAKQRKALDFANQSRLLARAQEEQPLQQQISVESANRATEEETERTLKKKQQKRFQPLGPNVMILPRKVSEVDKEMEVGRWKVIERELIARGLPVMPKGVLRQMQERDEMQR